MGEEIGSSVDGLNRRIKYAESGARSIWSYPSVFGIELTPLWDSDSCQI